MLKVPYSDQIKWDHPRPWGGGDSDWRAVRVYYGSHANLIPSCTPLTREDIAWVLLDKGVDPEEYDWDWAAGHDLWLWPIGFKTSPQTRRLTNVLKEKHLHHLLQVSGYDQHTLDLIHKGEVLVANAGRAQITHKHKYL